MCSSIPHIPLYAFMEWTEKASTLPPKIREDFKDDGCTKRMYDIRIRNTTLQPPALPGPKTHLQSRSKCDCLVTIARAERDGTRAETRFRLSPETDESI